MQFGRRTRQQCAQERDGGDGMDNEQIWISEKAQCCLYIRIERLLGDRVGRTASVEVAPGDIWDDA